MCRCHKKGNPRKIDDCILSLVLTLEKISVKTFGSCCGHGKYSTTIMVMDSHQNFRELFTGAYISRTKRFYQKDAEGYYFIPEVDVAIK